MRQIRPHLIPLIVVTHTFIWLDDWIRHRWSDKATPRHTECHISEKIWYGKSFVTGLVQVFGSHNDLATNQICFWACGLNSWAEPPRIVFEMWAFRTEQSSFTFEWGIEEVNYWNRLFAIAFCIANACFRFQKLSNLRNIMSSQNSSTVLQLFSWFLRDALWNKGTLNFTNKGHRWAPTCVNR